MTTRRIAGAAFLVLAILVCLPAFHSATGLHGFGGAVDAFDQGVRVPETSTDIACVVAVAAALLGAARRHGDSPAACRIGRGHTGSNGTAATIRQHAHSTRAHRSARASADEPGAADCESVPAHTTSVTPTPRSRVNSRGAEGSSVASNDRTKRKGVPNAV